MENVSKNFLIHSIKKILSEDVPPLSDSWYKRPGIVPKSHLEMQQIKSTVPVQKAILWCDRLPLMEMPQKIFQRNKRNYLTSSVESLYLFSSIEYTDSKGFVILLNEDSMHLWNNKIQIKYLRYKLCIVP